MISYIPFSEPVHYRDSLYTTPTKQHNNYSAHIIVLEASLSLSLPLCINEIRSVTMRDLCIMYVCDVYTCRMNYLIGGTSGVSVSLPLTLIQLG